MTDCTVLVLNEACLEKAFDSAPKMRFVLDCLVGEDVAKKLYAVSDVVNMSVANQRENQKPGTKNFSEMKQKRNLDFRRTASMDAIHTGGIFIEITNMLYVLDPTLEYYLLIYEVKFENGVTTLVPAVVTYLFHGQ